MPFFFLNLFFSGVVHEERTERSAKWQTGELSRGVGKKVSLCSSALLCGWQLGAQLNIISLIHQNIWLCCCILKPCILGNVGWRHESLNMWLFLHVLPFFAELDYARSNLLVCIIVTQASLISKYIFYYICPCCLSAAAWRMGQLWSHA